MLSHAATPIPATATHGSDHLLTAATLTTAAQTAGQVAVGVLAVALAAGLYLLSCLIWPFGKCYRCKGAGKFKSPFGSAYRHCGKCQGSGLRVRGGRRVINHLRAVHGAGSRGDRK